MLLYRMCTQISNNTTAINQRSPNKKREKRNNYNKITSRQPPQPVLAVTPL